MKTEFKNIEIGECFEYNSQIWEKISKVKAVCNTGITALFDSNKKVKLIS